MTSRDIIRSTALAVEKRLLGGLDGRRPFLTGAATTMWVRRGAILMR